MKSLIPIVFAIGCLAFSLQTTFPAQEYTTEDSYEMLALLHNHEVINLKHLTSAVVKSKSFLILKTLAAYKASQKAGRCAQQIQRTAVPFLKETANNAREYITSRYGTAREMLIEAETDEEIEDAIDDAEDELIEINEIYTSVLNNVSSLTTASIQMMLNCNSFGDFWAAEDKSTFLEDVSNHEIIILSKLTNKLHLFVTYLESKTLAAYEVSQEAGHCAIKIQHTTISDLTTVTNAARKKFIRNYSAAMEMLTEAETEEEIREAIINSNEEKSRSSNFYNNVIERLTTLRFKGGEEMEKCVLEHA